MIPYSDKLKDPRWQRLRLKTFERDNWTCLVCGSKINTLHCHHEKYAGNPWDIDPKFLMTVCEPCHTKKHYPELTIVMRPPIQTTAKFVLGIDYETYRVKDSEFIPADIQWRLKQFLIATKLTRQEFIDHPYAKNYFKRKTDFVKFNAECFHKGCKKWNVVVKFGNTFYGQD